MENSPTQAMKEKFESEMKKEIKKLQRLREFFRQNQTNSDIKDKSKLDQGRKMIEKVSSSDSCFRVWARGCNWHQK